MDVTKAIPFWKKVPGYRSGTKWKMIVASIFYFFFIMMFLGIVFGGDNTEQADKPTTKTPSKNYSLEFNPKINHTCEDDTLTIEADINCPDGAIMQVSLMSGDLKEFYTDEVAIQDGKISSTFTLENTDPKYYGGFLIFQFNAKEIIQPEEILEVYGKKGEKLKGDNVAEAHFDDGSKGKNASFTFSVPYPSEEVVEQLIATKFNEAVQGVVKASNGVILDIARTEKGIYKIMVSNSSWYLAGENEKQFFAEEMLRTFTQVGKSLDGEESIILDIYDESMNNVASSKIFGGMKIKK